MFPVTDHLSPIEQHSACNALSPKSKCTLRIFLIVYIVGSCVVLSLSRSLSRFNSSLWPELRISVGCECGMYKRAKFAGVNSTRIIINLPVKPVAATTSSPARRRRWRHRAKTWWCGGGGGPSPPAPGSGSAWILVGFREMSRWWERRRVRIRESELVLHLGKATCGGADELLAWFPLDLGRVVSPGAIVFRRGRGVSGVYSSVGGLLMLLSSPQPAVVAREWKGMAPPPSSLGLFVVFF
jgi:hypothetical protein